MALPSVVILTGAGISAESGIRTFRDSDGLWEKHRIEDVASPEGFERDPGLVQSFYNARRAQLRDPAVRPNAAHLALARLERERPGDVLVITQNVDDLHERAGSKSVIHMHGELLKARCLRTGEAHPFEGAILADTPCPCCGRPGGLRPHIVWFGEIPLEMDARVFAAIGTSGQVHPAAGFVRAVPATARAFELNAERSEVSGWFAERRIGPASVTVPAWVREILDS